MKMMRRMLAMLLALVMVLGMVPASLLTEVFAADNDPIVVIAGSDYQNTNGGLFSSGASTTAYAIMSKIKADYPSAYGFLFGGDYYAHSTNTTTESTNGKKQLKEEIVDVLYPDMADETQIYIQGNHDADSLTTNGTLATSGAHDTDYYGVYVINEKDYMWYNDDQTTIQSTAAALKSYLDDKAEADYTKPIFVLSHLPLHYSNRTVNEGDGKYAKYIYDVLDAAGASGLNIIFMYGHNHSTSYYEEYLGNGAVYLAKGDTIYIAEKGSQSSCFSDELNFTYMNYGFTGYLTGTAADGTLTMTVFEITNNQVVVKRYDTSGVHNLKSAGTDGTTPSGAVYDPTVYTSPQYITLLEGETVTDNNVSVTAPGLTGLSVTKVFGTSSKTSFDSALYKAYASYEITPTGYTEGDLAYVTITLDDGDKFDSAEKVLVIDKSTNTAVEKPIVNGTVTFTTNHFSTYDVAQYRSTVIEVPGNSVDQGTAAERTYTRVDSLSDLKDGDQCLFFFNGGDTIMTPEAYTYDSRTGMKYADSPVTVGAKTITGEYGDYEFTMTSSGSGWLLKADDGYVAFTEYSSYDDNKKAITFESTGTVFTITGSSGSYNIYSYFDGANTYFDKNSRGMVSGYTYASSTTCNFYIYRLTATAASTVNTSGGDFVTITEPTDGTTTYIYTLDTDGTIDAGYKYLIVSANSGTGNALTNNNGSGTSTSVEITDNTIMVTNDTNIAWVFSNENGGNVSNGSHYIYLGSNSFLSTSDRTLGVNNLGNGAYTIQRTSSSYYVRHNSGNWSRNSSPSTLYLYKYTGTSTTGGTNGLYGKIDGELTYNVSNGTSAADALATVKDGITIKYATASDYSDGATYADDGEGMAWTLDSSYDGTTPGEYAVTISYNDTVLGVAKVVVPAPVITIELTVTADSSSGVVKQGCTDSAKTGTILTVTDADGNVIDTVRVSVGMLKDADGNPISTANTGTQTGLNIYYTYNGVEYKVFEDYTLYVLENVQNNYPDYPDEGAVKVSKTANGIDFQSSGVANVELSVSGVPSKKGVDVIVMLDTSSSMTYCVSEDHAPVKNCTTCGTSKLRLTYLKTALASMLEQFTSVGDDGELLDIKVAIADFNGYSAISDKAKLDDVNANGTTGESNKVFTGSLDNPADAFLQASEIDANSVINELTTASGTNYDDAMETVYRLGAAVKAENEANGEERDLFVIFMSDGAPYQYNYINGGTYTNWNYYLLGTLAEQNLTSILPDDYAHFYNEDGDHWLAEAVKGSSDTWYDVIDGGKLAADSNVTTQESTKGNYFVQIQGLGAEMHVIGFCLADDTVNGTVEEATQHAVLGNMASIDSYGNALYHESTTGTDLQDIFCEIASQIAYAANNAYFVDQMGESFDLQLTPIVYRPEGVTDWNDSTNKIITPVIEVRSYDIYTRQDYLDGVITDEDMIGARKGTRTVIEKVTFTYGTEKIAITDEDGTINGYTYELTGAYSNLIDDGATNILGTDGVIYAKNFAYNTTAADVVVNDITVAAESFYWYIGTVTTTEIALNYNVYLSGALEGKMAEGSYATNNYATLYYENYLGNDCYKDTVSPGMAWESALVRYAFYLVNTNGQPVNANGTVVPFANKVAVTAPIVYSEIYLNNIDNFNSISVASLDTLPQGYVLYDNKAEYTIEIDSNATGSWKIVQGDGLNASTYVTDFSSTVQFSNELTADDINYDYTHTTVWFAVVWTPQCLSDTVVIDFGLPVDITVLTNDMFGDYGNLVGVAAGTSYKGGTQVTGTEIYYDAENKVKEDSADGNFGDVKVTNKDSNGNYLDKDDQVIRYTPNTMAMNGVDTFTYSVYYSGNANPGYYYGTVTVIPATTIYYEDSFLDYAANETEWKDVGETSTGDITQNEDRPGYHSLSYIDANNLYGYDGAYAEMSQYSLGSAAKVIVSGDKYATASFTFYGTGFDVISLTSNTSGTMTVKVKDTNGKTVKAIVVDTYYGYAYEDGEWKVVSSDASNALYQVPVVTVAGLDYAKYTVTITAAYSSYFDNTKAEEYEVYLDAIRIYDPCGTDNTTANEAYAQDGEGWPEYKELRDMIISKETFDSLNSDTVSGVVFIDGAGSSGAGNTTSVSDYTNYGPNNELYLAYGQSIAADLNAPTKVDYMVASVQLAIKTVGGEGNITVYGVDDNGNKTYVLNDQKISTATDMYYDITALNRMTLVIKNSGTTSSDAIISLTNIKVTYTKSQTTVSDDDLAVTSAQTLSSGATGGVAKSASARSVDTTVSSAAVNAAIVAASDETGETYLLSVTYESVMAAIASLTAEEEEEPEVTEPEETEPEETEPEETVPEETVPEETEPEETVPEETVPEETIPEETVPQLPTPDQGKPGRDDQPHTDNDDRGGKNDKDDRNNKNDRNDKDHEKDNDRNGGKDAGNVGNFLTALFGWLFG